MHFIKHSFIYKGKVFTDLHTIFQDNSVISYVPNFDNLETPIICYNITNQLGLLYLILISL